MFLFSEAILEFLITILPSIMLIYKVLLGILWLFSPKVFLEIKRKIFFPVLHFHLFQTETYIVNICKTCIL